jgi:spermidine synthase
VALELGVVSFVVLFQELALIRWLPTQVRVLAYFPNLILIAAFLGLGLGCLRAGRRSLLWTWPVSLLAVVAAAFALSRIIFTQHSASEHLFLLYYDLPPGAPVVPDVRPPIVLFFVLAALSFMPLGQFVAERLSDFRARSSVLWGYCFDIGGSLLGVTAFALLGFSGAFPLAWFALVAAVGAFLFRRAGRGLLIYVGLAAATLLVVARAERAHHYSPYYAITLDRPAGEDWFAILTNGSLHQRAFGVGAERPLSGTMALTRRGYHRPYRLLGRPVRRALVVGAGSGNDVAVLLAEGAQHVDAVEIDPVILEAGRRHHPDRPYDSPRVRAHNTDARSFLNDSREQYDLIVFGTLDSMTSLSALANVRLDNFVYTLDCLRAARSRLTPDGGIVLYFMVATDYIDVRLMAMLTQVFGELPFVEREHYLYFNRVYMAGPAFARQGGEERRTQVDALLRAARGLELPSDDWPFLYLRDRGLSAFYVSLAALFALLAALGVFGLSGEMRRTLRAGGIDVEMFLFGLAFLLLETRSVTQMSLAWGVTWLTSAVVFGSILLMVLLGTLAAQLRPPAYAWGFAGLALTLLASYATPTSLLLGSSLAPRLALSLLFVGAPIFFASVLFALRFRARESAAAAFGWNLLGAVAGGLLEMVSMAVGFKALLLLALLAYLLAALLHVRAGRPAPAV